jgi:hypothetical protein
MYVPHNTKKPFKRRNTDLNGFSINSRLSKLTLRSGLFVFDVGEDLAESVDPMQLGRDSLPPEF